MGTRRTAAQIFKAFGKALTVTSIACSAVVIHEAGAVAASKVPGPILTPMVTVAHSSAARAASHLTTSCQSALNNSSGPIAQSALNFEDLAQAYDMQSLYASGDRGAGTTIALVEFAPFLKSDIATFIKCLDVHTVVTTTLIDGGSGAAKTAGPDLSGQLEVDMDVEEVIGLAPAARIEVFEGSDTSTTGILDTYAAAVASGANVISTSWGTCEAYLSDSFMASEAQIFQHAAQRGETVVAASGDEGSEGCYGSQGTSGLVVDDPASQPDVTAVGGTTLTSSHGSYSQSVWNEGTSGGASGGGNSSVWQTPGYQVGVYHGPVASTSSNCSAGSTGCRMVPDVSADAGTPVTFYCSEKGYCDGWNAYGGTSVAAPLWAAVFALADANSAYAGSPLGFVNPALYSIGAGTGAASAFTDIQTGNNDLLHTTGTYSATTGYDLASGLGSPLVGNGHDGALIAQLCTAPRASVVQSAPIQ